MKCTCEKKDTHMYVCAIVLSVACDYFVYVTTSVIGTVTLYGDMHM